MTLESKLIPILREGVEIMKMISFKKIKEALAKKHPERQEPKVGRCVVGKIPIDTNEHPLMLSI